MNDLSKRLQECRRTSKSVDYDKVILNAYRLCIEAFRLATREDCDGLKAARQDIDSVLILLLSEHFSSLSFEERGDLANFENPKKVAVDLLFLLNDYDKSRRKNPAPLLRAYQLFLKGAKN